MKIPHLEGRRYTNLVRCSTDQQADTSPEDQRRVLNLFAGDQGMISAGGDIVLEGVSGSITQGRTDIDEIVQRKIEHDDFDVLLVQDVSRLTRGGMDHLGSIKTRLSDVGVEVFFATHGTSGDPDQDALMHSLEAFSSKQQMKAMSYAVVRGMTSSLDAGKTAHSYKTAYGLDRLYFGPNGEKRHRIRNLADRSQQKLAVDTDMVMSHYPANPPKGRSCHYKMQSDERYELIPGAAERVKVMQQIYRRHLIDGWGGCRIASELNNAEIKAADGGGWHVAAVDSVLSNTVYSGLGVTNRFATGLYHMRGTGPAPEKIARPVQTSRNSQNLPKRPRKQDQWRVIEYPQLVNFLGDDLAKLARAHHEKVLAKAAAKANAPARKKKPGGDRHIDSGFILKGMLRCVQGDLPLTGKSTGLKDQRTRYYATTRGANVPSSKSIYKKMIPAEPLEQAVLAIVREVLLDVPNLRNIISREFEQQVARKDADCNDAAPLLKQRDEVAERLRDAMLLGSSSRKLMQKQFDKWETQLALLEERIAAIESTTAGPPMEANAFIKNATAHMGQMAEALDGLAPAALRQLLKGLISKLVVNLETREVEMELALPEGFYKNDKADAVCLVPTKVMENVNEAQRSFGLKIASITCQGRRGSTHALPCFTCNRVAA